MPIRRSNRVFGHVLFHVVKNGIDFRVHNPPISFLWSNEGG